MTSRPAPRQIVSRSLQSSARLPSVLASRSLVQLRPHLQRSRHARRLSLLCRHLIAWTLVANVGWVGSTVVASEPRSSQTAELEPATEQAIQTAVDELNSPSFAVRERATRELWGFGEQVRPLLMKLVESDHLETRQRSMQILADFEYGITPDVAPHIARLLRQYRTGTPNSRLQVLSLLFAEGDLTPLRALAKRTLERGTRHIIYSRSIESTPMMIGLIENNELDDWVAEMNKDEFRQPRHEIVSKWLTSSGVLEELNQLGKLSIINTAIAQEANDENRNRLLRRLFVQREFTDFYSAAGRIDEMLGFIEVLPNRSERHDLFVRFLSLARNPTIYDPPTLTKLKRFASEACTPRTLDEFWIYTVDTIIRRPEVVTQMTPERIASLSLHLDEAQTARLLRTIRERAPDLLAE